MSHHVLLRCFQQRKWDFFGLKLLHLDRELNQQPVRQNTFPTLKRDGDHSRDFYLGLQSAVYEHSVQRKLMMQLQKSPKITIALSIVRCWQLLRPLLRPCSTANG